MRLNDSPAPAASTDISPARQNTADIVRLQDPWANSPTAFATDIAPVDLAVDDTTDVPVEFSEPTAIGPIAEGSISAEPGQVYIDSAVSYEQECSSLCDPCSPWYNIFRPFCSYPSPDSGIGTERVMFAPFLIENARPQNFTGFRFDLASGLETPDRAELFWAKQGQTGPALNETQVDYQEFRLVLSTGNDVFSTTTEVPIRFLDPEFNGNTAGLGDISIATKLLLIDGDQWKVSQFFKTITPTGSKIRGLGAGHVSLEPGLLAEYQWTERTYLFGEFRYLFGLGGDPVHSGQRLRYGVGLSTVYYETDEFAILPTMELVGFSVLDGGKTLSNGLVVDVDSENSAIYSAGCRFVLGPAGDLGLIELGINAAFALNDRALFSTLGIIDLRFVY